MNNPIHVVAGIVRDPTGRILLAQRLPGKHLAGLWEFPGGKCKAGEAPEAALRRELREELGIDVGAIEPLISFPWQYPEKTILLDVYDVLAFNGNTRGLEGQALRWLTVDQLAAMPMPPADRPVVASLRLPPYYAITPEPGEGQGFLTGFKRLLASGVKCIQLRSKSLPSARLLELARTARDLARPFGVSLLINSNIDIAEELALDGVHLPATDLMRLRTRPLGINRWVAASCHDENELAHAAMIGVDFATLSPIEPTSSHAAGTPLGWQRFGELCETVPFPVYALGGLGQQDVAKARSHGAQGIAGISAFWPLDDRAS